MAPEVIRGETYGRSADIWSLGCVVIELATGNHAWSDQVHSNHYALMYRIATGDNVPTIPSHLSPEAQDFISQCLQRNPAARPSIQELARHPFLTRA